MLRSTYYELPYKIIIMKNLFYPLIVALSFFFLFHFDQSANAQSITIDPTFGQNGVTVIPNTSEIRVFDFDRSGNIIAVGYTINEGNYYLTIVKTNADGIIDRSFGINGIVNGPMCSTVIPLGLKITQTNKIFITGYLYAEQYGSLRITFLQFNEDGSFDETFGENGKIIIDSKEINVYYAVNTVNNNFVLLGGTETGSNLPIIVKLYYNGEFDESFGENGVVYLTTDDGIKIVPRTIKILNNQSILIAGLSTAFQCAFCKIDIHGNFVKDFANNGIWRDERGLMLPGVTLEVSFLDVIEDHNGNLTFLAILIDLMKGHVPYFLCRFDLDGNIYSDFGKDGYFRIPLYYTAPISALSKMLQNGSNSILGSYNRIMSINSNGVLDTTFNHTGIFICENYSFEDVKFQDTKLILGGSSNENFSLARLNIPINDPNISVQSYSSTFDSSIIFPNPAKDYLYFKTKQQFAIFDIYGRKCCELSFIPHENKINISNLKTGIYFIKFEDGRMEKFVKE
jgi:uncharacterized delta-60 repeat protein